MKDFRPVEFRSAWIDCKYQMPPTGQIVLCFDPSDHPNISFSICDGVGRSMKFPRGFTHWMPLPSPPTPYQPSAPPRSPESHCHSEEPASAEEMKAVRSAMSLLGPVDLD